jgi:hypothetical protein
MKVLTNELYTEFRCLAGDCPETCCYGWRIIVDEQTRQKMLSAGGFKGWCLKRSLGGPDKNYINHDFGSCIFHGLSGLCIIQKRIGEEYMPEICRRFPREMRNYGLFGLKNVDLSCIAVSRALLYREGRPCLVETDEEMDGKRQGTNDDAEFGNFILDTQQSFVDMLKVKPEQLSDVRVMDLILRSTFGWCLKVQEKLLQNTQEDLTQEGYLPQDYYARAAGGDIFDGGRTYFPLPIMALNRMINTDFDREDSRFRARVNLSIEWYHRKFDRKTEIEGQQLWKSMVRDFFLEDPFRMEALLRYLQYYFQQCYAELYENYSFVHFAVTAIMHTNMILFLWVNYARKKKLTTDIMAALITSYERGACHNLSLEKELYSIACDYLPV